MIDIIKYLHTKDVPKDKKQTHKLCIQVIHITLINDQLYKLSFEDLYLKCLSKLEPKYVLIILHDGIYDNHPRGQTLAHCAYT